MEGTGRKEGDEKSGKEGVRDFLEGRKGILRH